jgi:hypothetical protein
MPADLEAEAFIPPFNQKKSHPLRPGWAGALLPGFKYFTINILAIAGLAGFPFA